MPQVIIFALLLTAVALGPRSAHAIVAFDNFGPGSSTSSDSVIASGVDGEFGERLSGLQFTATATGLVSQLSLVVSAKDNGRPNDGLRLTLFTDNGDLPGTALESLVVNDVCYVDFDCPTGELISAQAAGSTLIEEGSTYWLVASADLPTADFAWYLTTESLPGLVFIDNGFTGTLEFEFPPALRVKVVEEPGPVVPEPGALSLLAVAALGLILRIRPRL